MKKILILLLLPILAHSQVSWVNLQVACIDVQPLPLLSPKYKSCSPCDNSNTVSSGTMYIKDGKKFIK